MPLDFAAPVLRNVDLGHGNLLIEFEAPDEVLRLTRPGQFFMIGIPGTEVLLRRPFSVCGLPGTFDDGAENGLQVLYHVFGRATGLLAALKTGARLDVLGPLGRGFEPPPDPGASPILVAGGIGCAAFPLFVSELRRAGRPPAFLHGARTAADLPLAEWFRERCGSFRVATDDGSAGAKGFVTELLPEALAAGGTPKHLYACGPTPMLRAVTAIARERSVPCHLALEAPMACGFGVCLGCVVPCRDGEGGVRYERCCVEGPVMPAEKLAW